MNNLTRSFFVFPTCLMLGSALLLMPALTYAQGWASPHLDALSQAALNKIHKALKHNATDVKTKAKLNKIAKALRKETLIKGSSSGISKGDFNGDGFADLAIGLPHEDGALPGDVGLEEDSGQVVVIYGAPTGLGRGPGGSEVPVILPQFWSQRSPGIPGDSQALDEFGTALASGDFNGDGFSDLAIGIPHKTVSILFNGTNLLFSNAGRVIIIYGSPNGLTATDPAVHPPQSFDFSIFGPTFSGGTNIKGNERLGFALAWGDFNGDGVGDLAMGAPGRDVTTTGSTSSTRITVQTAGEVWVLFGSRPVITCRGCGVNPATGGLTRTGKPVSNVAATTLPEEFLNAVEFLNVEPGTLHPGGVGTAAQDSGFGSVLAAGDFNGDGETDLVAGLPDLGFGGDLAGNIKHAGGVILFVANALGQGLALDREARQGFVLTELSSALPLPAAGNNYGAALAVGDFNGDSRADLAIGIPGRMIGPNEHAGAVHVRYGKPVQQVTLGNPLPLASDSQIWTQNALFPVNHPLDRSEPNEFFGAALAAGDFNGDGKADLAIGVPLEDVIVSTLPPFPTIQNIIMAGEVDVVYGSLGAGLSISVRNPQIWTKGLGNGATQRLQGTPHAGDLFGFSLSAWNFGDPSFFVGTGNRTEADLAIGAPFEDLFQANGTQVPDVGAVNVIYGSPGPAVSPTNANGLTSQGNQLWTAGSPGGIVEVGVSPLLFFLEAETNFGLSLY
jgi:FG-GAP repeat protein